MRRLRVAPLLLPVALLAGVMPAAAQELPILRAVPESSAGGCPTDSDPAPVALSPVSAAEIERLVTAASQSAILGDHDIARDLLIEASALDPTAEEVIFLLGQTLERLGEPESAIGQYCRYLHIAPEASSSTEARERIDALEELVGPRLPDAAVADFRRAIERADAGDLGEAEAVFTAALRAAPDWAAPYFNRGVVRVGLGRPGEALGDLHRFLALEPESPYREQVTAWLELLQKSPRTYSPGLAFAYGLVPGIGQFHVGRPLRGLLVLGGAGGGLAAGMLYERIRVQCSAIPENGVCAPDHVLSETSERPFLLPGAGIAVLATLLGAIDAYRQARSANAEPQQVQLRLGAGAPAIRAPSRPEASGVRIDLALIRVLF